MTVAVGVDGGRCLRQLALGILRGPLSENSDKTWADRRLDFIVARGDQAIRLQFAAFHFFMCMQLECHLLDPTWRETLNIPPLLSNHSARTIAEIRETSLAQSQ